MRFPHSLGLLYSAFTAYCGFEINEGEYKLMGMHPYGKPTMCRQDLRADRRRRGRQPVARHEVLRVPLLAQHTLTEAFEEHFGARARDPKLQDKSLDPYYCDMAASIQKVTEEILLKMVHHLHETTG